MKYRTGKIKVRYNETDQMGIVHHSNYLKFFELARIEWLEKLNMPYEEIERNNITKLKICRKIYIYIF